MVSCSIFCSVRNQSSDNESHKVHKLGDPRCILSTFVCPFCEKTFQNNKRLQVHLKQDHTAFETSFPSVNLTTENSVSDIYETCSECNKKFANELDVQNHMTRVHEYGEPFALYPCEDCGFRATDLMEIRHHIESEHKKNKSLQSLGKSQLPVVSKRRKHQFNELEIDEDGNINSEEEDEEYDDEHIDELLLVDDDDDGLEETSKTYRP